MTELPSSGRPNVGTVTQESTQSGIAVIGNEYSGTWLNGHSTVDTHDIMGNSDHFSIDFNIFKTPEKQTPRYSVYCILSKISNSKK